MAFYHEPSRVLFTGDHLCSWSLAQLTRPAEATRPRLVVPAEDVLDLALGLIRAWAADPAEACRLNLGGFLGGLADLARFPARALASGHGVCIMGDIPAFVAELRGAARDGGFAVAARR